MLRRVLAALPLVFLLSVLTAETIPPVQGHTFTGEHVSLPADLHGRPAIFVIGFTKDSRTQTSAWSKKLIEAYSNNSSVALYNLLPLDKVPRLMRGFVTRAIRNDVSDRARPYFVILDGHENEWRTLVHASNDNSAYVVLCNARGNLIWQTKGALTPESFAALRHQLEAQS